MVARPLILLATLLFAPLFAERQIELVGYWSQDYDHFTQSLKRYGLDAEVVPSDLSSYAENLKKPSGFWESLWDRIASSPVPLREGVEKIVFFNLQDSIVSRFDLYKLPKEKMVLFMWEPKVILYKMYKPHVAELFSRIYTWDDDLVDGKRYFKFYYPALRPMIEEVVPFEEKKLCTLVASNFKCGRKNSLYRERGNIISFFEEKGEMGFEFYGRNWDIAKHPSYRGPIPDKIAVIRNYRFSICYENCRDVNGYVTEKIFDCFAAGNVPVYLGASNIEQYVPKDCFIDRRDFANDESLYQFLKSMTKEEYEGYIQRIRAYLTSDAAQLFSPDTFEAIFKEACE